MKTEFARGVQIAGANVKGWQTFVLLDVWPNGQARPIAFLDTEALQRIHEQSGEALVNLRDAQ